MVEGDGCVEDCGDPAWGGHGEGTCNTSLDPPMCWCDDGFAPRDALGHATCVPKRVLMSVYVMLAVGSYLTTAVVLWEANKFRSLPAGMGASPRRTSTRLRALISSRQVS